MFSKIDLKWGFHQVELEEESRYLTTFAANGKLYRFRRLPFGISSAPELYQKIISDVIKDLAGCRNGADDILLHADSLNQHDVRVHALMNRLQQVNLTVNPAKCDFAKSSSACRYLTRAYSQLRKGYDPWRKHPGRAMRRK